MAPRKPAPIVDRGPVRNMDVPEEGYWLIRVVSGGPWVPARIWYERNPEHSEPEPWANGENRILGIFAAINGKQADPMRVWHTKGRPIDENEYHFLLRDAAWIAANAPRDPKAQPDKKVDLSQVTLPF